ncbi:MAG: hypothetical protein ACTHOB_08590 [Ginsengibacter sp.]
MQKEIMNELLNLKSMLAKLIGTSDLSAENQFSDEAINRAAKEFQKLFIEREEWINDSQIARYIKGAGWNAGKFIREEFQLSRFYRKAHTYYYYKKDIIAIGNELKKRNVDLNRYMELKSDQADFKKKISSFSQNRAKKKLYSIPSDLRDISTSLPPKPSIETIRDDLNQLKKEFFQYKLSNYIDVYKGNHAMMKRAYYFDKYLDPELKKRSKKWCENFNYANEALTILGKKETFPPVKEEEMIQL